MAGFGTTAVRRATAALVIAAFLPMTATGCFGRFELTRKVYRFNQRIDPDKWIQWLVFLVLNVIPIYSLSLVIDVLFANSVEFWTGSNPILSQAGERRTVFGPGGERVTALFRAPGVVDVEVVELDGDVHRVTLVRNGDSVEARSADGTLLATLTGLSGEPRIVRAGAYSSASLNL